MTRAYHNLTAKYNYYFNAKESYTKAIERTEKDFNFNYTFPLPVLLVGQEQTKGMVGGDMDRAITKCTNMIRLHSITVKPERKRGVLSPKEKKFHNQNEFVKWVRKGWLLIGKSRVWKGAYDEARMTFEHVLVQFPDTPKWYEAQVWMARINLFNDDFVGAEDRLRAMSNNNKYPKDDYFTHLLESTWASFYQKQDNVNQTIKHLEKAYESTPNRETKVRYAYLLGQLYQEQKDYSNSNEYFRKVTRLSSSYEINFNSRINMASNFQGGSGGSEMIKELKKMADDEKNLEYLDQIYYALGNIEKSKGNTDEAMEYFQLSAQRSVSNNHQKGISYLELANYFFDRPNYTKSQSYYDSAYNALTPEFPGYRELETKTKNLNSLVDNLNTAEHQDSLLRVAAMSTKERDAIIAKLIKEVRDEEERLKREEQENRDRFAHFQRSQRGRSTDSQGGKWYFYNQSSLSQGLSEFQMKWGRRDLEDNWRRGNKREVQDQDETFADTATDEDGSPTKVLDNKSREYYLQDLPTNDSLAEIAHNKIKEALLRVGEIYENKLKDYPEANAAYNRLIDRYPKSSQALQAYYNLYQIARYSQNESEKDQYKRAIISNFPESTYALMLGDPQYVQNMRQKQRDKEEFYAATFDLYKKGNFAQAKAKAEEGMKKFDDNDLQPKFQFIVAQSIGHSGNIRSYKNELLGIVKDYPETEVAKAAADIIVAIEQRELQLATTDGEQTTEEEKSVDEPRLTVGYKEPDGEHLFLAIAPKGSSVNQLRFNLVSFNADHFINMNLNVGHRDLTDYVLVMTVDPFEDKEDAMEYYSRISQEDDIMGAIPESDYSFVIISRENFELFMDDKSVTEYLRFFRNNYQN
ncbi:MAG: tetratricopeptide repeat protein [Bacteroidales bacterium]